MADSTDKTTTRAAGTKIVPAAAAMFAALLIVSQARAEILYNPQGWKFPNIVTAAKEAIHVSDRTPEIPGKETLNKGYRRIDGTHVMTYEIEGKIFGVEIDEDGKPPFEYGIMDADGDGKFETKIVYAKASKDHFYVPAWVIDYYFKVHPEVQRGPGGNPVMPSFNTAQMSKPPVMPPGAAPQKKPGTAPPPTTKKKPITPDPSQLANP